VKENTMDNERTVAAELHRLAEAETHDPIDTAQLLARGRRGLRRRRSGPSRRTAWRSVPASVSIRTGTRSR
jgi:hypothetical protein